MNVYFKTITIRLEIGWQIHSRCTLLKWKVKQENKLVCTCYFFLHFSKQSNEQFETAFRIGSEIQYRHWTFRCESSYFFFSVANASYHFQVSALQSPISFGWGLILNQNQITNRNLLYQIEYPGFCGSLPCGLVRNLR